jgi:hypothetical protein
MSANFSERLITENTAIRESFPYQTIDGPVEHNSTVLFNQPISGAGVRSIFSFCRFVTPAQPIAATTTIYPNFDAAVADNTYWKVPVITRTPFTTQSDFVINRSGVYFIHYMFTSTNPMSNNSDYFVELIFYGNGGVDPGVIASTAQIGRTGTSFGLPANSKTFFRRFALNDRFTFRVWQSEANPTQININVVHIDV